MADTPILVDRAKPMIDMPTPPDWDESATLPRTSKAVQKVAHSFSGV